MRSCALVLLATAPCVCFCATASLLASQLLLLGPERMRDYLKELVIDEDAIRVLSAALFPYADYTDPEPTDAEVNSGEDEEPVIEENSKVPQERFDYMGGGQGLPRGEIWIRIWIRTRTHQGDAGAMCGNARHRHEPKLAWFSEHLHQSWVLLTTALLTMGCAVRYAVRSPRYLRPTGVRHPFDEP